jgi:hypothetical protein
VCVGITNDQQNGNGRAGVKTPGKSE